MSETEILDSIEGATIVSAALDVEDSGLHINLADGRVLIFMGQFAVGIARIGTKELH